MIKERKKIPHFDKDKTCKYCKNYPCFDGIDNLESDFAKEGCRGYELKKLNNYGY